MCRASDELVRGWAWAVAYVKHGGAIRSYHHGAVIRCHGSWIAGGTNRFRCVSYLLQRLRL